MKEKLEFLKIFDIFGIKLGFYTDKSPKLYSSLSGIISITSILLCIAIFILINIKNFSRNLPYSFLKELYYDNNKYLNLHSNQIYIPWHIIDSNGNLINSDNIICPQITYFYKNINKSYTKRLKYKYCDENLLKNEYYYKLNISLDKLFCIDFEDKEINISDNLYNFIELSLYLCNYNDINEHEIDINLLYTEIFYPKVYFYPEIKNNKPIIIYKNQKLKLNKNIKKIININLQENILKDESGWFSSKSKNFSFWGVSNINSDIDMIDSNLLSLKISLDSEIIMYSRKYINFFEIIQNSIPIVYIIFIFIKNIIKQFKLASISKKMSELLFENLKEKKDNFEIAFKNKIISVKDSKKSGTNLRNYKDVKSTFSIQQQKIKNDNIFIVPNLNENQNKITNNNNISREKFLIKDKSKQSLFIKPDLKKDCSVGNIFNNNIINNLRTKINKPKEIQQQPKQYYKKRLFSFRYYLYAVLFKYNNSFCGNKLISKQFFLVYNFISQLLDISTYFILLKEFNTFKKSLDINKLNLIESQSKININSLKFIREIQNCIEDNNISIFGKKLS